MSVARSSHLTCAHFPAGLAQRVERALACRAEGQGFYSPGRTNTQGLKSNLEMKVLPLHCKRLDLRVARMTK